MNERRSHHYENSDTRFPGTNANQPWKIFVTHGALQGWRARVLRSSFVDGRA